MSYNSHHNYNNNKNNKKLNTVWRYDNISFFYDNPVGSVHGEFYTIPFVTTYMKSKYALNEAVQLYADTSFMGPYAEINFKTLKHDPPYKV